MRVAIIAALLLVIAALLIIRPEFNFGSNPGEETLKVILKADANARNLGESLDEISEEVSLVSYETTTETEPNYVRASDALKDAWDPRYKAAVEGYEQMISDLEEANESAREYFDVQREYTNQIFNPEIRARAEESDKAELQAYLQWQSQAGEIIRTAEPIMRDLKDMDIIIQKQNLSAHFLALRESLSTLPDSISNLHAQVEMFHQESLAVQSAFNQTSPQRPTEPAVENSADEAVH